MGDGSGMPIVFMLVMLVVIGIALMAVLTLARGRAKILDKEKYRTDWLEIENSIDKKNDATYQFAILSADKLLDRAMRESGISGKTMGDRLKRAGGRFQDINGVWTAHKLRNKIAHEVNQNVSVTVARRMLTIYKNALHDLGAI